jgi:tyrosyl-tRNA synthetase
MSKSNPDSAIFMDDSEKEVQTKIKKAFCEPKNITVNPCLEYIKFIVLPYSGTFTVSRKEENGGDSKYTNYEDVEKDFLEEKLHPSDLKPSLAKAINEILQPVRDHFKNDKNAAELLKKVKSYKPTK